MSITDTDVNEALEHRTELLQELGKAYSEQLDDQMGQLYNQFVVFISSAGIPLPQVLLVLEMLVYDTIHQSHTKYLGGD